MKRSYILVLFSASLGSLAQAAEVIYAVATVQHNGDLTYTRSEDPTKLTALGKQQLYNAATFYRNRYVNATSLFYIDGIRSTFDDSQVYAMAPDQPYQVTSGQVFLQGLFPPQNLYNEPIPLQNGQTVQDPSNGIQFTTLHSVSPLDPNTIWLEAGDGCPNYQEQGSTYLQSSEFLQMKTDSQSFYDSLIDQYLAGVFSLDQIGYQSAFEIFNFMHHRSIYNSTFPQIDPEVLSHLKTLADSYEWAMNGNASSDHPALTVYGKALAFKIAESLTINYDTAGMENKFTLLVSSYKSFLGFFGHAGLSDYSDDFKGLPNYAATMVFELFSNEGKPSEGYPSESVLRVRFLFRNGTEDNESLSPFPIFGMMDIGLLEFQEKIDEFSVKNITQWCELCSSHEWFCSEDGVGAGDGGDETSLGKGDAPTDTSAGKESHSHSPSPAVSGVIGAICVIVAVLLGFGIAMSLFGLRFARTRKATTERGFRGGEKLPSEIDLSKIPPPALKV